MISAIQVDDAINAEALLAAGLYPDSEYEDSVEVRGYQMQKGSTLLHWAAVYYAPHCAKVRIVRTDRAVSLRIITSGGQAYFTFSDAAILYSGRLRCVKGLPVPFFV